MCQALDRDARHGEKSKLMGKGEFPRFAPRNLWEEIPEGNYAEVTFGHTACDQRSSAPCSHVTQGRKCMTNVGTRAVAGLVIRCLAFVSQVIQRPLWGSVVSVEVGNEADGSSFLFRAVLAAGSRNLCFVLRVVPGLKRPTKGLTGLEGQMGRVVGA